ncbi:hypothetical protein BC629DRAFT_1690476 [Irpex lacteus]|nr:hypothetical protein BC629DRAFT_1690476 [Irpex lacteus]
MPGVDDMEINQLVDSRVDAFWKAMEGGIHRRGQISVTFSEKRPRKTWFISAEEEVPWEQWTINAEIRQPATGDRQAFDTELASALTKSLQTMLTHTSSERGRSVVPLITNAQSISPFPYKIVVRLEEQKSRGEMPSRVYPSINRPQDTDVLLLHSPHWCSCWYCYVCGA